MLREPDALDRLGDDRAVAAAKRAEEAAGREPAGGDDLAHGRGRVDAELGALREIAERRAAARTSPPRSPKRSASPGARPLEPEREPQQRRLAAAVRAGDRDELARLDREIRRARAPAGRRRRRTRRRGARPLPAPERLPERREVLAHDGEVVLARVGLLVGEALDRVEDGGLRADLARDRLARGAARRASRRRRSSRRRRGPRPTTSSRSRGVGSASGETPVIATCCEAVALGQVAERGVARDDLVTLAVGEAGAELAVERGQPGRERLRLAGAVELLADPPGDRGVADRIEPDVRVDAVLRPPRPRGSRPRRGGRRRAPRWSRSRPRAPAGSRRRGRGRGRPRRSRATSLPASSMSCGSTPGGVRLRTTRSSPPICSAAKASG